ncbi:MAG: metallophosphoesterase [Clostridia bacterium]
MKKFVISLLIVIVISVVGTGFFLSFGLRHDDYVGEPPVSTIAPTAAPTAVPFQPHRFVFLADSRGSDGGINEPVLKKLLKKIKALKPQPEYIVFGGDLITGSTDVATYEAQLQTFADCYSKYFPLETLLPVFGNHEEYSSTNDLVHEQIFGAFFSQFTPTADLEGYNRTVYYKDLGAGDARLVVLNSYHVGEINQITKRQFEWFQTASLVSNGVEPKTKFVFLHSPPYPTGGHVGSALDMFPKERDKFWKVVDNTNYIALFCGHEHIYSRRLVDSSFNPSFQREVNQVIAGAAGAISMSALYTSKKGIIVPPKSVYHFVVVDVKEKETKVKAISIKGKTIDQFTVANN